jgi:hypothetical protein
MMHLSMKLLGRGDQEYFNEKRPVNVRVGGTAYLAEALFCITYTSVRNCCTIFNCLRPAYPALSGRELDPRRIAPNQSLPRRWRWPRWPGPSGTFGAQ